MANTKKEPDLDDLENECRFVLADYWSGLIRALRVAPSEELVSRLQKASIAYNQFEADMNPDNVD